MATAMAAQASLCENLGMFCPVGTKLWFKTHLQRKSKVIHKVIVRVIAIPYSRTASASDNKKFDIDAIDITEPCLGK